jgi:CRP/FNR family cyclic AMP-dependent transcriptional regulator
VPLAGCAELGVMQVGPQPPAGPPGRFLASLPEVGRDFVLGSGRLRSYEPRERLVRMGEEATSLFILESGRAAVRVTTPAGDNLTLAVLGPGDVFGEAGLFSARRERTATVQALDAVTARVLREQDVGRLRREHDDVNDFFLQLQARRIDRLSRLVTEAHQLPVDKRVARRLYEVGRLYREGVPPISLPLSQEEIAQIAGTTRPTANQVLQRLQAEGVVELSRGAVALLNIPRLRALGAW